MPFSRCLIPLISLLASSLLVMMAGCGTQQGVAVTDPPLAIRTVADASPQSSPTSGSAAKATVAHAFVGATSCAAAGCHGNPSGNPLASSFQVFSSQDPHRSAFLVLYSERSVMMYRALEQLPSETIDEGRYLTFLQQRCIGCHATPLPTEAPAPSRAEDYLAGVSCESCHGPAGEWQYTHYAVPAATTSTSRVTPPGMSDIGSLVKRGGLCVTCHIGPQQQGGRNYDVNHDLIASGHPRLTFELDAYLANLPAHWDRAQDERRHQQEMGAEASSFHFDAWRMGQYQVAKQQATLTGQRAASGELDFANYDCHDCHHALESPGWRQPRINAAAEKTLPGHLPSVRPATLAGEQLDLILARMVTTIPKTKYTASEEGSRADPFRSPVPEKARPAILLRILERIQPGTDTTTTPPLLDHRWDRVAQFQLGLAAYLADFPAETQPPGMSALRAQSDQLGDLLGSQFVIHRWPAMEGEQAETFAGGQYDSPSGYNPHDPRLKTSLDAIREELKMLSQ